MADVTFSPTMSGFAKGGIITTDKYITITLINSKTKGDVDPSKITFKLTSMDTGEDLTQHALLEDEGENILIMTNELPTTCKTLHGIINYDGEKIYEFTKPCNLVAVADEFPGGFRINIDAELDANRKLKGSIYKALLTNVGGADPSKLTMSVMMGSRDISEYCKFESQGKDTVFIVDLSTITAVGAIITIMIRYGDMAILSDKIVFTDAVSDSFKPLISSGAHQTDVGYYVVNSTNEPIYIKYNNSGTDVNPESVSLTFTNEYGEEYDFNGYKITKSAIEIDMTAFSGVDSPIMLAIRYNDISCEYVLKMPVIVEIYPYIVGAAKDVVTGGDWVEISVVNDKTVGEVDPDKLNFNLVADPTSIKSKSYRDGSYYLEISDAAINDKISLTINYDGNDVGSFNFVKKDGASKVIKLGIPNPINKASNPIVQDFLKALERYSLIMGPKCMPTPREILEQQRLLLSCYNRIFVNVDTYQNRLDCLKALLAYAHYIMSDDSLNWLSPYYAFRGADEIINTSAREKKMFKEMTVFIIRFANPAERADNYLLYRVSVLLNTLPQENQTIAMRLLDEVCGG